MKVLNTMLLSLLAGEASARLSRARYQAGKGTASAAEVERILMEEDTRAMFRHLFAYGGGSVNYGLSLPEGMSMPEGLSMPYGLSMPSWGMSMPDNLGSMPTPIYLPPTAAPGSSGDEGGEEIEIPPEVPPAPESPEQPATPTAPDTIQGKSEGSTGSSSASSASGFSTGALVGVVVAAVAAALLVAGLVTRRVLHQSNGLGEASSVASPSNDLEADAENSHRPGASPEV